jgi:hypothetical protein
VGDLAKSLQSSLEHIGAMARFFGRLLLLTPGGPLRVRLLIEQVYNSARDRRSSS